MPNKFEERVKQNKLSAELAKASVIRLSNQLQILSIDSKGSKLSDLLSISEVKTCKDFIKWAKKFKFPFSDDLYLEKKKNGQPLTDSELIIGSWTHRKVNKLRQKLVWQRIWHGKGYLIGFIVKNIDMTQFCSVYLCNDSKLRCSRGKIIFGENNSIAHGYGTLPSKNILKNFKFVSGHLVIDDESLNYKISKQSIEKVLNNFVDLVK